MLWVPRGAFDYRWRLDTTTGRPAAAFGATVTPGNNSKGSYAQLIAGASVTEDVWAIRVRFNSGATSGAARDIIADLGIDTAGGSSYTVLIPNLLASCAGPHTTGGIGYWFPVFIPAGSSIGVAASVNNATVGTLRAWATLYGKPRNPEATPVGYAVEAVGVVTGSSRGTTVTAGTTSEGSWTSLGTTTRNAFYAALGVGFNDTAMGANVTGVDLAWGDASNKLLVVENQLVTTTTGEASGYTADEGWAMIPSGTTLYGRAQCSGTADTMSLAAYLVAA